MTKIALVHDWLTGYRGGEKVLHHIAKLFENRPIYTLFYHQKSTHPDIESHPIHPSFLNHLPFSRTHYRYFLPLFPLAAEFLILKHYDLIISTSHAVAKSVNTRGALHWCYVHAPMRYAWERFDDYFGPNIVGPFKSRYFFKPICNLLQMYDRATAKRVQCFVANSTYVQQRIQEYYHVDCQVIYPPIELQRFLTLQRNPQDYYLFFSALVPYKKAEHAIQACQQLKKPLKILGKGPELNHLKNIAHSKYVTFIENPSDTMINEHYAQARALLFPGTEDFGMIPVEASASGLPVIGYHAGGLLDSQTHETCTFYHEQTVQGLVHAIQEFEQRSYNTNTLKKNAMRFSEEQFKQNIQNSIFQFTQTNNITLF